MIDTPNHTYRAAAGIAKSSSRDDAGGRGVIAQLVAGMSGTHSDLQIEDGIWARERLQSTKC
jgi:hypothetical protein